MIIFLLYKCQTWRSRDNNSDIGSVAHESDGIYATDYHDYGAGMDEDEEEILEHSANDADQQSGMNTPCDDNNGNNSDNNSINSLADLLDFGHTFSTTTIPGNDNIESDSDASTVLSSVDSSNRQTSEMNSLNYEYIEEEEISARLSYADKMRILDEILDGHPDVVSDDSDDGFIWNNRKQG
ncbi:hypothetical protein CVT25_010092 [Psilocybe cyanescens]|uniref:Uncharacterized protein n=1 Tax=Psilocybe cyanescens TaxID=93625 RepID=A0A409XGS6_PSICY|nr:hypothetical protein CVT25_010092 [Psilocybe cyanescens]